MLSVITQSDAEYTAAIAIDGKRDSIAMKTISILGIVYLPATFVATLFSINMFTWGGTSGEEASSLSASPSIWIYWAVAVPLTVITILVWILWSKRENQKSNNRLMVSRMKAPEAESMATMTHIVDIVPSEKMV
jgi:Mg2+ and Co2+ transporter CorA